MDGVTIEALASTWALLSPADRVTTSPVPAAAAAGAAATAATSTVAARMLGKRRRAWRTDVRTGGLRGDGWRRTSGRRCQFDNDVSPRTSAKYIGLIMSTLRP